MPSARKGGHMNAKTGCQKWSPLSGSMLWHRGASTKERQSMLRIFSLVVLTAFAIPSHATEISRDDPVIAQQQQAPQQTPKRDCERKRDEGVSS
jgi:hypothetical protein